MGRTGVEQIVEAGYKVRIASWLPITEQYISSGVTLTITPIHHAKTGNTIFVSKELAVFLDSEDSMVDPARPLQAICKFKPDNDGRKKDD